MCDNGLKDNLPFFPFFASFGVCFSNIVTAKSLISSSGLNRLPVMASLHSLQVTTCTVGHSYCINSYFVSEHLQGNPSFSSRICVIIFFFFSLQHCFLESCLFEAASLTGCSMIAKGFLPSPPFVLQKPCSSLKCIREFCSFCV